MPWTIVPATQFHDFAAMAASGANAVRLYTAPPRWLLDLASGELLFGGMVVGTIAQDGASLRWCFELGTLRAGGVSQTLEGAVKSIQDAFGP